MKRVLLLTALFFTFSILNAQSGSWKIKLNNKIILTAYKEDMTANNKTISRKAWKKTNTLEIVFTEDEKDTWIRSFLFCDKADNEIVRRDSTVHAKISSKELKKLFAGKKEILIYTTIAPVNPSIAIRMRRVHLCTLQLP